MTNPAEFEAWVTELLPRGGVLNATPESRRMQNILADAVMSPEVTIMSRAVARTGIDEIQARMTLAVVYAFENRRR